MLAEPLESLVGWKRWWVVTDGALDLVPLAALRMPGGEVIGARHEIVNLPSASAAAEIARLTSGRARPVAEVAVFADPVFRTDDNRMANMRAASTLRGAAIPGTDVERLGSLPRLYFSRDEAEAISQLAARKRKWVALDFDASRAAVESGRLADYRIVHFATHGILNTRRPELSGIVLSMIDRKGKPIDGFLALHDIYNLKLNADLVVLSGCRTALGESVRSEGIVGLTRGFLHAGSAQVLASLWSVPDRGTAEFMRRFYDALLRRGEDAVASLNAGTGVYDARSAVERSLLLGGFPVGGRARPECRARAMTDSSKQTGGRQKPWDLNREALDGLLRTLGPDPTTAAHEYEASAHRSGRSVCLGALPAARTTRGRNLGSYGAPYSGRGGDREILLPCPWYCASGGARIHSQSAAGTHGTAGITRDDRRGAGKGNYTRRVAKMHWGTPPGQPGTHRAILLYRSGKTGGDDGDQRQHAAQSSAANSREALRLHDAPA